MLHFTSGIKPFTSTIRTFTNSAISTKGLTSIAIIVSLIALRKIYVYFNGCNIKKWDLDKTVIVLRDVSQGLELIKRDKTTGQTCSYKIPWSTKNKVHSVLRKTEVRIIADGDIFLFLPEKKWSTTWGNFNISLNYDDFDKSLIWKIFSKDTKKTYWLPFDKTIAPRESCSATTGFIKDLLKMPTDECISWIDEFEIANISWSKSCDEPSNLVLKPRFVTKSAIEPTMLINSSKWITTMIISGKSFGNIDYENHVIMLIEGVKSGEYFLEYAHLNAVKGVKTEKLSEPKDSPSIFLSIKDREERKKNQKLREKFLKSAHRSSIIVTNRRNIQKMRKRIKQEADKIVPVSFAVLGSKSIFTQSGGHNCISWVLDKYKKYLGIEIPDSMFSSIMTNPRSYAFEKHSKNTPLHKSF
jgi:hypothetical protein